MNSLNKVVVFGATSDIAIATLRQLIARGASVYCVARNGERLEHLLNDLRVRGGEGQIIAGEAADLSDMGKHEEIWRRAQDALKGVDAVLVAHGVMHSQADCQRSIKLTVNMLIVNAVSVISLLTPIANDFEEQKKGVIAVISSVAGDRGRQSNYVYGSAKGMLNVFLQGLRNRLFKSKVSVLTVKPGFTRTKMTEGMKRSGFLWADPSDVARGIIKAMQKGKDVVYLKPIWWLVMFIIRAIPEALFKRLKL